MSNDNRRNDRAPKIPATLSDLPAARTVQPIIHGFWYLVADGAREMRLKFGLSWDELNAEVPTYDGDGNQDGSTTLFVQLKHLGLRFNRGEMPVPLIAIPFENVLEAANNGAAEIRRYRCNDLKVFHDHRPQRAEIDIDLRTEGDLVWLKNIRVCGGRGLVIRLESRAIPEHVVRIVSQALEKNKLPARTMMMQRMLEKADLPDALQRKYVQAFNKFVTLFETSSETDLSAKEANVRREKMLARMDNFLNHNLDELNDPGSLERMEDVPTTATVAEAQEAKRKEVADRAAKKEADRVRAEAERQKRREAEQAKSDDAPPPAAETVADDGSDEVETVDRDADVQGLKDPHSRRVDPDAPVPAAQKRLMETPVAATPAPTKAKARVISAAKKPEPIKSLAALSGLALPTAKSDGSDDSSK